MIKRYLPYLRRSVLFLAQAVLIVFVTIVLAGAFAARKRADLEIWHTASLPSEFRAGERVESLQQYLDTEERVFSELDTLVTSRVSPIASDELNRFLPNSRSFPERGGNNWNRTQILEPDQSRGAVLMLHGMTDSPYSMRHFARLFHEQGFYVVNLRIPGHGTIPAELATVNWRDWDAAVRIGAAHAASRAAAEQPFLIVGYSNGGALAVKYALDSVLDPELRPPDHLVLISPMLGVSGLARFGEIYYWLGKLEFFQQALWLDILPEYDPHKYNSFPMNALRQSLALIGAVDRQMRRATSGGDLSELPPILAFQSLVDSTVVTRQLMGRLFDRLPDNGSELILFDVNRKGVLEYFVSPAHDALLTELEQSSPRNFTFNLFSNKLNNDGSLETITYRPGSDRAERRSLELAWPAEAYSLSHVALPFPPDDEIYGYLADWSDDGFPAIGRAQMVGENGALTLPASLFARIRSNPFHDYVEERILELIEQD